MSAVKHIVEVIVQENVHVCLGQNRLECSYLGQEAFRVDWRVFPIQAEFDGELDDLAGDADHTHDPERVGHLHVGLRMFNEVVRSKGRRRWS